MTPARVSMWSARSKKILRVLLVLAAAFVFAALFFFCYLFFIVPNQDTGDKFTKENILRNLSGESRVFYSDGTTVLGSFFDVNHRLYVHYDSIPQTLIDAIVSSEDADFWEHRGFSVSGFTRAMFNNIRNLSFRQSGSTLSQQTVKNVFGREETTVKAKWHELTDALKLEKHFSKQEILEFYLNQFQVYSSGRGAAIAATYFFNKPLSELSLEECAFIAGSVKGPFNYDPRVQKTPEKAKAALEKGQNRTRYVLRRMYENGYIDAQTYETAKMPELNYGEFRYNASSLMEKVDRELDGDFYANIFENLGIEDWRGAQLKITTTLDASMQSNAEKAVRENLGSLQAKIGADTANPLQGALVAIKNGMVVAAQSGMDNIGYDRVFVAERQMGSAWKPFLFALALKLGWNSLDELENEYNLFTYGNTVYFPRPDHSNRGEQVSIAWAAVRSENIASIWLLEHLLDKLPISEIRNLAANNLIDTTITSRAKNEIALEKAKEALTIDWLFEGKVETIRALQALKYYYNKKEADRQSKNPERVKLLQHSYEFYESIHRSHSVLDTESPNEMPNQVQHDLVLFPNFSEEDFEQVKEKTEQFKAAPLTEDDKFLLPDLRKKIAMKEFANFVKSIGINRNLQEVMSMPLGVNEATIAEMALAYQSILSGKIYKCADKDSYEPCIIKEIKNRNNNLIFENKIDSVEILPKSVVLQMQAMLRSVFKYGTAASAYNKLSISYSGSKYPFPAMGKTGTTNENRTASFCGALPLDTLLTICSYIGFDDNNKLKGKSRSLAGASGALPQWANFAQATLLENNPEKVLGESIDYINTIAEGEVPLPRMPQSVKLDKKAGLPLKDSLSGYALFPEF